MHPICFRAAENRPGELISDHVEFSIASHEAGRPCRKVAIEESHAEIILPLMWNDVAAVFIPPDTVGIAVSGLQVNDEIPRRACGKFKVLFSILLQVILAFFLHAFSVPGLCPNCTQEF